MSRSWFECRVDRLLDIVLSSPRFTLTAFAVLLCLGGAGLMKLTIDTSPDAFIAEDNPALVYRDLVKETFGLDDPLILAVSHAETVVSPAGLELVERLTREAKRLENVVPGRVVSLATESFFVGSEQGIDIIPFSEHQPEEISAAIDLFYPVNGSLVARDRKMAIIVIELADQDRGSETYQALLSLVDAAERPSGFELHIAGQAAISSYLAHYIDQDAQRLLPFTFLVIFLVLAVTFRSALGVIVPLAVAVPTLVATFAAMGWTATPIYLITNGLAAILVGISVADSVHILSHYAQAQARGMGVDSSIRHAVRQLSVPIALTSITTIIGFMGVWLASSMPPMIAFGVFAMFGVLIAWLVSMVVVPALISVLASLGLAKVRLPNVGRLAYRFHGHGAWVIAAGFCAALIGSHGASRVSVNDSEIGHFQQTEDIVLADQLINEHMDGTYIIDVVVTSDEADGLLTEDALTRVSELRRFATDTLSVRGSAYFSDVLGLLGQAVDSDSQLETMGEGVAAQLLLLHSSLEDPAVFRRQIDLQNQRAVLRLYLDTGEFARTKPVVEALQRYLVSSFNGPAISAELSGRVTLNYHWVSQVFESHGLSIVISAVLLFAASVSALRSFALGAIALVTVAASVLCVYAIMGFGDIWLNAGTSMFAAIALGLGIDFSIHVLYALKHSETADLALEEVSPALIVNGSALCLGFATILVSQVPQVREFGLLVASAVFAAMIFSLLVSPALFSLRPSPRSRVVAPRG